MNNIFKKGFELIKSLFVIISLIAVMITGSSALYAETLSIHDYLNAVRDSYERIDDYQCRMHEFSIGGGRREERIINYYFKKPLLIRIDILDGNKPLDEGSVGVYTGGKKVTGHRGGFMKGMVLSVKKDSALAMSVRGETIERSNVLAVIERMEHLVENGTVAIQERDDYVEFVFIPFNASINEGISRDVVWIERDSMLIIRIERYEEETLVQQAVREDYIINAGLPKELFDAHFETEQLKDSGIPLLSNDLVGNSITP